MLLSPSRKLKLVSHQKRNLSKEEVELLQDSFVAAKRFINRTADIIEQDIEAKLLASESEVKYDSPNWMLYQADNVGYRRGLRKALELLGA
jgi:hypothetical protein